MVMGGGSTRQGRGGKTYLYLRPTYLNWEEAYAALSPPPTHGDAAIWRGGGLAGHGDWYTGAGILLLCSHSAVASWRTVVGDCYMI